MTTLNHWLGRTPGGNIRRFVVLLGLALGLTLLGYGRTPLVGHAAFPGENGKIAFFSYRSGNPEIFVMNNDGSNITQLTFGGGSTSDPVLSPDGSKIAFLTDRDNYPSPGYAEIYVMAADGTNQTRLTVDSGADIYPSWSPDGSKLVFQSDRDGNFEIYVMNADGSNQTRLTFNAAVDYMPSWSPNGSKIAFQSDLEGNFEIYTINIDGSGLTNLTNNPADEGSAEWSPDGSQIAFNSTRDGAQEVYVMNADGGDQTRLTFDSGGYAGWSPDGAQIAYEHFEGGVNRIFRMNADGTGQVALTDGNLDSGPNWQPLAAGDTTPPHITPTVSGTPGSNGWYVSDVTINWTVNDPESAVTLSSGCDSTTLTGDTVETTFTCSATNGAGLSNSASVTVKVDKTAPDITIMTPPDGSSYAFNAVVTADYSCVDTTAGIAACNGQAPTGSSIDTSSVGLKTFTVSAIDNAGHTTSLSHTYQVIYNFSGFFPPVDNLPTFNRVKAGQAIPVKFSLSGNQGLNIFASGSPKSQKISCDTSAPASDIEETVSAGNSNLSYDPGADQYVYVWKTDKSWSGSCRQLIVNLNDGTSHLANFAFTK